MGVPAEGDWRIDYLPMPGEMVLCENVRAAFPTTDDLLPGWTLLKDSAGQVVKMIRSDGVRSIERLPEREAPPSAAEPATQPPSSGMESACREALESFGMVLYRRPPGYSVAFAESPEDVKFVFSTIGQVTDFTDARAKAER